MDETGWSPGWPRRMRGRLAALKRDRLVRHSVHFVALWLGAAGLLYLFQILMARQLGPEKYGTFKALLSVITIVASPLTAIQLSVAQHAARWNVEEAERTASAMRSLRRVLLLAGAALAVVVLLLEDVISSAFDVSLPHVIALAAVVGAFPLFRFEQGRVQGAKRFGALGGVLFGSALVRLLAALALIAIGLGVGGALLAVAAEVGLGLAVLFLVARVPAGGPARDGDVRTILSYSVPIFLAQLGFAVLTSMDAVALRAFFPPDVAGQFAGAATLGKALLFFSIGMGIVVTPMASESRTGGRRMLLKAILFTTALMGVAVAAFALSPGWLIQTAFGGAYADAAGLVPLYALAMGLLGIASVILRFDLARARFAYPIFLCATAVVVSLGMIFYHPTAQSILGWVLVGALASAVGGAWRVARDADP